MSYDNFSIDFNSSLDIFMQLTNAKYELSSKQKYIWQTTMREITSKSSYLAKSFNFIVKNGIMITV